MRRRTLPLVHRVCSAETAEASEAILRKIISYVVASAICGAGIWLVAEEVFAGALLIAVGGYWLWVAFIAPAFGRSVDE